MSCAITWWRARLTPEEFEERVERAYRASTRGELDALKADLPMSPAAVQRSLTDAQGAPAPAPAAGGRRWLGVSAVCIAIWVADGASGSFWPGWVILFTLLPLVRDAWRLLGPAPDLEAVERHLNAGGGPASRRASATATGVGSSDELAAPGRRARAGRRPRAPPREGARAGQAAGARARGAAARRGELRRGGAARQLGARTASAPTAWSPGWGRSKGGRSR